MKIYITPEGFIGDAADLVIVDTATWTPKQLDELAEAEDAQGTAARIADELKQAAEFERLIGKLEGYLGVEL